MSGLAARTWNLAKVLATDPMRSPLGVAASRKIFGNAAGCQQNVNGYLELWNARRKFTGGTYGEEAAAMAEQLRTVGFAKAPWTLDAEKIETIRAALDAAIEEQDTLPIQDATGATVRDAMLNVLNRVPEIADVFDDRLRQVLYAYFQSHVHIYEPQVVRTRAVPEQGAEQRDLYSNFWHNDATKPSILSCFVLLTEVTEAHGPTHVINRAETKTAIDLGYVTRNEFGKSKPFLETEATITKLTGAPGTMYFINPSECLHKASFPQDGNFRDLIFSYFTATPGDADQWAEPQADGPKFLKTIEWHRY